MLEPRCKVSTTTKENGQTYAEPKYAVYDSKKQAYVFNKFFTHYDTKKECQEAIDFFDSLKVVGGE